ncbi:MAG: RDD family protein, partial [Actinomycetota bacterium]|nr:RDD family protein [Actinomycetota bacterium]
MARTPGPEAIAHADDDSELITGEAVALDVRPAGFILRGAGAIIDWLVYFGSYILLLLLIANLAGAIGLDGAATAAIAISTLVVCIVVAPIAVELATSGKSLGKLAIGARIVRDDGGAITFRHAFIRALTGVLEIYLTFGGFAALFALLSGKSKRMGDYLAGTYAQHERLPQVMPNVFGVPVPLQEWATTADVGRLPDRLARRIAQFLSQAGDLVPATRARIAAELAAETAVWVFPV